MATGFVAGGSDLDTLFQARTSAPIANTGFKSNGFVDIAQRFEPRGATTPIGNTNFKAGANDLAQLFRGISSLIAVASNMVAGTSGSPSVFGYQSSLATAYGSLTPNAVGVNAILTLNFSGAGASNNVAFSHGSVIPADADTTWQRIEVTGVYTNSGGASVTRTITRSATAGTGTGSGSGYVSRTWNFVGPTLPFITGNSYNVTTYRA